MSRDQIGEGIEDQAEELVLCPENTVSGWSQAGASQDPTWALEGPSLGLQNGGGDGAPEGG